MSKIKVEIEVPNDKYDEYCEDGYDICPVCLEGNWGKYYCAIFGNDLEIDLNNGFCKRCDKCKKAEVKDESIQD